MYSFPPAFFELALTFGHQIASLENIPLGESLYKYTPIYTRLIGFSDLTPPDPQNPEWQSILANLPANPAQQLDFIYTLYTLFEDHKKASVTSQNGQVCFGCFSYFFNPNSNNFALHFTNADPEGNLGKDRIPVRIAEFKQLTQTLFDQQQKHATVSMTSWLLSIPALQRLLPPQFVIAAQLRNKGLAQDNGWWGQFVDKKGNFRPDLGQQLLTNAKTKRASIDDYFPVKTLKAEVPQEVFFEYYLK